MVKKRVIFGFVMGLFIFFSVAIASADDFGVDPPFIRGTITIQKNLSYPLKIYNLGEEKEIGINVKKTQDFIVIDKEKINLAEGGRGVVNVVLYKDNVEEGISVGSIEVSDKREIIKIPVLLGVETPLSDFDLSLSFPETEEVSEENMLNTLVNVYNLRSDEKDVELTYEIFDLEGNSLYIEKRPISVERQYQLQNNISVKALREGNYILAASVAGKDSTGVSALLFNVPSIRKDAFISDTSNLFYILSLSTIFLLVLAFVGINNYWNRRLVRVTEGWKKRVEEIKKIRTGGYERKVRKLKYQKYLLRKAYSKKFIKRSTYRSGTKKIDDILNKIHKKVKNTKIYK
jgi:hypothetical protein